MFRLVLVAYLALITFAGPAVCCCTASGLTGGILPRRSEEQPTPHTSHCHGHRAGGLCHAQQTPHTHPHRTTADLKAAPSNDRSPPPKTPCSCHETRFEALTAKASDVDAAQLLRLQVGFVSIPADATVCVSISDCQHETAVSTLETTTFPHMSAPEILRALQTFRC
jgi:hypothetical protein